MEEDFEDYLENAIEIAENEYDIPKQEILYNKEHFEECFENNISVHKAVEMLSGFCL